MAKNKNKAQNQQNNAEFAEEVTNVSKKTSAGNQKQNANRE
ncbi:hypothetical protein ACFFNY_04185 [Paenibacillus hodogayensis]|uniref:Small, acid-soluble spore protein gamma-type n=1 Tax=Paenibacillus hodogayensis TaxID=279208 RepID=A0ABV5VR56_9BACL